MDLFLLYILTGIALAIFKRLYKKIFGIKTNTKLNLLNKIALIALWLIFPLRLIAESTTAAIYNNGDFLTQNFASIINVIVNPKKIEIYTWWSYSSVLFLFFTLLPFTRYMHIPTEMFFITLKKAGIEFNTKNKGIKNIEIYSCSSCGICISNCQMYNYLNKSSMVPSYYLYNLRKNETTKKSTYECLMCGRCEEFCPVKIDILEIKSTLRQKYINNLLQNYIFIKYPIINSNNTKIGYFAGCMTHLTPSIIESLNKIFKKLNTECVFIDKDSTICCGRPLKLAGKLNDAKNIISKNTEYFNSLNLNLIITSCPICYKTFKEDYNALNTKVIHHSQWLADLINAGKLNLKKTNETVVYHDPCELGRGTGIYEEPRRVITAIYDLAESKFSKNNSLCCGGSLGNFYTNEIEKIKIAQDTLTIINTLKVNKVITACPLCKKTFQKSSENFIIKDISEIIAENL
ncbi:MAG: (Fe-S)-binding protein [Bacteroidales bacterium]|nr:(Fe-S)-binding protein [Bacteroidales bacterium]